MGFFCPARAIGKLAITAKKRGIGTLTHVAAQERFELSTLQKRGFLVRKEEVRLEPVWVLIPPGPLLNLNLGAPCVHMIAGWLTL